MDSNSLYYFQELCRDLNMHRTSERIYVSQQTISNHILRLEAELGCKLFERRPSLKLTDAGQETLRFVNRMILEQMDLKKSLADITREEKGTIRLGASMLRLNASLPLILPEFLSRYPNVNFQLKDRVERELENLVLEGKVDLGIIVEVTDETGLIVEPLLNDQVYVCVPDPLLRRTYGDEEASRIRTKCSGGTDLSDLSALPFCILDNRLGKEIHKCFDAAGFTPKVCITSSFMQIAASVGIQGISAFFITQSAITGLIDEMPEDLNIFPLLKDGKPYYHRIYLIRRKDGYLPTFTRYFLDLLKKHYEQVESTHAERIVKQGPSGTPRTRNKEASP